MSTTSSYAPSNVTRTTSYRALAASPGVAVGDILVMTHLLDPVTLTPIGTPSWYNVDQDAVVAAPLPPTVEALDDTGDMEQQAFCDSYMKTTVYTPNGNFSTFTGTPTLLEDKNFGGSGKAVTVACTAPMSAASTPGELFVNATAATYTVTLPPGMTGIRLGFSRIQTGETLDVTPAPSLISGPPYILTGSQISSTTPGIVAGWMEFPDGTTSISIVYVGTGGVSLTDLRFSYSTTEPGISEFLRTYVLDDGQITVRDLALDGTPYVVKGTVKRCAPDPIPDTEYLLGCVAGVPMYAAVTNGVLTGYVTVGGATVSIAAGAGWIPGACPEVETVRTWITSQVVAAQNVVTVNAAANRYHGLMATLVINDPIFMNYAADYGEHDGIRVPVGYTFTQEAAADEVLTGLHTLRAFGNARWIVKTKA